MKYIFKKKRNIFLASLIDAAGYLLARILRWRRPQRRGGAGRTVGHVLVIRMDHLGDVLLASPAPKAIKENYPHSRVSFLTSSWAAPLLENNPFVDEVMIYDAPWFTKKRYKKNPNALSLGRLIRALREKRIDTALGLRGDLRENLIMALSGIKERVGYGVTGGGFLLTKEIIYRKLAHERERLSEALKGIGIKSALLEPHIYFSEEEERLFSSKLASLGLARGGKYIGFQVDAGTSAKEWPASHIQDFLKELSGRFPDYKIVLVGSSLKTSFPRKRESDLIPAFAGMTTSIVDLRGKTTLRELCLSLKTLNVFVGFDSGPAHIAAALGVPTVFLYSGTNAFDQWKPLAENARVLRHPVPCSPCGLEVCNVKGHPCMSEIKLEEVIRALDVILSPEGEES